MAQGNAIPPIEAYWSLVDKADKKFSGVRDLPPYARPRSESEFQKVFKAYTRLWKFQQENRQRLVESGLKRWEIGEIASRIAQLYHGQYLRTCDAAFLSEAYIFYEAILAREYFREGMGQDVNLANKQLRFLARFLVVCLLLGRKEMVHQLVNQLRMTLDECKASFPEANFKDWKKLLLDILKFLKADTAFMNRRPLRYIISLDPDPDCIKHFSYPRKLKLREAILCSYHHNEIKFAELTLDTFRMHQCLEWEPSGSFYQAKESQVNGISTNSGSTVEMAGRIPQLPAMTDPSLPPNPRKAVLYRPVATHFLAVLASLCEELRPDGILLIYLSASGKSGLAQHSSESGASVSDSVDLLVEDLMSVNIELDVPSSSPIGIHDGANPPSSQSNNGGCIWLCSHGNRGVNCLYPCDLMPFTRRPLFLIVDSESSGSFMAVSRSEIGEKIAMLLSPCSPSPAYTSGHGPLHPNGSQFTMFLTAPLQAFCLLLGLSGSEIETVALSISFCVLVSVEIYNKAEQLLSLAFTEWTSILATSDALNPVWAQIIHDPFLRRLLLRFIFCKSVLGLYAPTFNKKEFSAECVPRLPESVLPSSTTSQSKIFELANIFRCAHCFIFPNGNLHTEVERDDESGAA